MTVAFRLPLRVCVPLSLPLLRGLSVGVFQRREAACPRLQLGLTLFETTTTQKHGSAFSARGGLSVSLDDVCDMTTPPTCYQ